MNIIPDKCVISLLEVLNYLWSVKILPDISLASYTLETFSPMTFNLHQFSSIVVLTRKTDTVEESQLGEDQ